MSLFWQSVCSDAGSFDIAAPFLGGCIEEANEAYVVAVKRQEGNAHGGQVKASAMLERISQGKFCYGEAIAHTDWYSGPWQEKLIAMSFAQYSSFGTYENKSKYKGLQLRIGEEGLHDLTLLPSESCPKKRAGFFLSVPFSLLCVMT